MAELPEPDWNYDWEADPNKLWLTYRFSLVLAKQFWRAYQERSAAMGVPTVLGAHEPKEGDAWGSWWFTIAESVARLAEAGYFLPPQDYNGYADGGFPIPYPFVYYEPGHVLAMANPPTLGYPPRTTATPIKREYPREVEALDSQWDHWGNRAATGQIARMVPLGYTLMGKVKPPIAGWGRLYKFNGAAWVFDPEAEMPDKVEDNWRDLPGVRDGAPMALPPTVYLTPRFAKRIRDALNAMASVFRASFNRGSITAKYPDPVGLRVEAYTGIYGGPATGNIIKVALWPHLKTVKGEDLRISPGAVPNNRWWPPLPFRWRIWKNVNVKVGNDMVNVHYKTDPTGEAEDYAWILDPAGGALDTYQAETVFKDTRGNEVVSNRVGPRKRGDARTVPATAPDGQFYGVDGKFGNGFWGGVSNYAKALNVWFPAGSDQYDHPTFRDPVGRALKIIADGQAGQSTGPGAPPENWGDVGHSTAGWSIAPPHAYIGSRARPTQARDGFKYPEQMVEISRQGGQPRYTASNSLNQRRAVTFYAYASKTAVWATWGHSPNTSVPNNFTSPFLYSAGFGANGWAWSGPLNAGWPIIQIFFDTAQPTFAGIDQFGNNVVKTRLSAEDFDAAGTGLAENQLTSIGTVETAEAEVIGPAITPQIPNGIAVGTPTDLADPPVYHSKGVFVDHWVAVEDWTVEGGFIYTPDRGGGGEGWPPEPILHMDDPAFT